MAEVIKMPKMSDTMEEGIIAAWLKQEGDTVKAGDILAEVETDKATMELEAYEDGTLLHIGVQAKAAAPVNSVIAIIGEKGEDITSLLQEAQQPPQQLADPVSPEVAPSVEKASETTPSSAVPSMEYSGTTAALQSIFASPLAKKMAQDKGYDLSTIKGTGEKGRIVKRDIENFTPTTQAEANSSPITLPPIVAQEAYDDQSPSPMRQAIAKRLSASKFSAPHFYLTIEVNMDKVVAARPRINDHAPVKVSLNDIIVKAAALAIRHHPAINVAWLDNTIRHYQHIHIGVAMAIAEGLVVPTVRFADNKSLTHLATEIKNLHQQALQKQLQPQALTGSTFTISNLGMLGIESFTAIINPPAACIMAVGAVRKVPVVKEDALVPGHVMKVTLSCDHRAVDGAVGAAFLQTFQALLQDPIKMLV